MISTTRPLDDALLLYAELSAAQIRSVQRRIAAGQLHVLHTGMVSSLPKGEWPALLARNRLRVLAALHPKAVMGFRTAFDGGAPSNGVVHLSGTYRRKTELPGLVVQVWKGPPAQPQDQPMMGLPLYFPSEERLLLENLTLSRGENRRTVGAGQVEKRLLTISASRGENALQDLRERARAVAPALGLQEEFSQLDALVGSILRSRPSVLTSRQGKAITADIPYDSERLALFESLAQYLRATPVPMPATVTRSGAARRNFAFLESYFSNFIEGTEFEVEEARAFVLEGVPVDHRPKDSHDVIGVFEQALSPQWSTLTLPAGEAVLEQLRERHRHQMKWRPEVGPGEFKLRANRAGNTEFVAPELVRGTLVQTSHLLSSVPAGTARALLAMFLVAEVHPFNDGNGRLARLVMNAELSSADGCRIIVPTLFREEYMDCLRNLTRNGEPAAFVKAMTHIQQWTSRFDYEDLDVVIAAMRQCNAFERSRTQFKLGMPEGLAAG